MEIKFRAWDKELEFFQEDENIFINQNGGIYREDECEWYEDRYDIQLFTGLYDSKRTEEYPEGQEIYNGDIIEAFKHGDPEQRFVFPVTHQHCFMFGNWTIIEFLGKFRKAKVIGNIHENPDLLKNGG